MNNALLFDQAIPVRMEEVIFCGRNARQITLWQRRSAALKGDRPGRMSR